MEIKKQEEEIVETDQPEEHQERKKPFWWFVALSLLMSLFSSVTSLTLYDRYFAQKVIAVDIKGYIDEQRELYSSKKISLEEAIKRLEKLDNIADFTKDVPKNRVVLMGDAVVKNAEIFKP